MLGVEKIIEEIMAIHFPNLVKDINLEIEENPNRTNLKKKIKWL